MTTLKPLQTSLLTSVAMSRYSWKGNLFLKLLALGVPAAGCVLSELRSSLMKGQTYAKILIRCIKLITEFSQKGHFNIIITLDMTDMSAGIDFFASV